MLVERLDDPLADEVLNLVDEGARVIAVAAGGAGHDLDEDAV
jgi:hypothetical protein